MTAILAFLVAPLLRVSPFIIERLTPILLSSSAKLWKAAYPVALGIVMDLADNGQIDGLDKHREAINQLQVALKDTGKFTAEEIDKLHLGQVVLAAYASTLK